MNSRTRPGRPWPWTTVAFAVLGCLATSGCASSDARPITVDPSALPQLAADAIVEYGDVHAVLDPATGSVSTSLTEQSVDSPHYMTLALHALALATDECMVEHGFDAVAPTIDWAPWRRENRLFGRWSSSLAAEHGLATSSVDSPPGSRTAAYGVEYNRKLPQCQDIANQMFADDIAYLRDEHIDSAIFAAAYASVLADPIAQQVLEERDTCLARAGVVVDPDIRFVAVRYRDSPRAKQIEVMLSATRCQSDTGVIRVLFDLQSRYETAYMDTHRSELDSHVTRLDAIAERLSIYIDGAQ